ncbi:ABC transporter permease [candidate division CSSED10-310 bacterium]|uniref:ABC transporter permease n=1 Tax=candidate division CSSED10-310 bacterium TaxID=2855610 RepID=A0ABV6YZ82_UNCC1
MAIPVIYNFRSVKVRFTSTLVAILAIAGVVAVFIAVLAMAQGFQKTLVASGSPDNAIILRGGANSEMESSITLEQVKIIGDGPGIKQGPNEQPLMSAEVVVIAALPLRSSGTDANVQIRGVSEYALQVRNSVKIKAGRFFRPGVAELVVGRHAQKQYQGFDLGNTILFGGQEWQVVGIMDAGGSAFDSEAWCDAKVLNQAYKRPENIFQSVTVRLVSAKNLQEFSDSLTTDPRLTVSVKREIEYYEHQSEMITTLIRVLGFLVASIMGLGAIFGALNTMYSSISARVREIATLRAIGFREGSVVLSFLFESLLISLLGGILGTIIILPIHGYTASTMNWQTFSHLAFAFTITPAIILQALFFALLMGFIGGLFPAVRAARLPIVNALRGL